MHALRNEVLSAPTSFFALALLRHAVRLACFAAASLEGATAAGTAAPGGTGADGAAANPPAMGSRLRHTAAATVEKRTGYDSAG